MNLVYAPNPMFIIVQVAGVLLLLSVVWLLSKGTIYLDAQTKKPVKFQVPIFGKIQTHSPVIALVVIAAGLVIYPATRAHEEVKQATIEGSVETDGTPVTVTVVMVPKSEVTVMSSGTFKIQVPLILDTDYRARFSVHKEVQTDQSIDLIQGQAKLVDYTYAGGSTVPPVAPKKEVSDDKLKSLGIS